MTAIRKLLLLLALAPLTLGACTVDDKSSIVIRGRAMPEVDEDGCSFDSGGELWLGPGTLDVGPEYDAFLTYRFGIYVDNNLAVPQPPALPSAKSFSVEAARIRLNPASYVNELHPAGLLPVSGETVLPVDGQRIAAAEQSVVFFDAIDHETGLMLQGSALGLPAGDVRQVVLGISLQGHTLDGEFLETNEWYYPIFVCVDCLPSARQAACVAPEVPVRGETCATAPGQDVGFFCVEPATTN